MCIDMRPDDDDPRVPPPLDELTHARLAAVVARDGHLRARTSLGLTRDLLARALAGLPVRAASALMVRAALDALDERERVADKKEA